MYDYICPPGWSRSSYQSVDWTTLTTYLGGESICIGKLKKKMVALIGLVQILELQTKAVFTALPGGSRDPSGQFFGIIYGGDWWSATENNSTSAWGRHVGYNSSEVFPGAEIISS